MIIEFKDKLHKVLSAFEHGVKRWTRFMLRRPDEADAGSQQIQKLKDEQIKHEKWKKDLQIAREALICDYLSSAADKIRSTPNIEDKIKIDWALRPNFMPSGSDNTDEIGDTEVIRSRVNPPVNENAEQQLTTDLAMRQRQREEKPKDTLPEEPGLIDKIHEECSSIQQIHKRLNQL